jgi:hypothetical protein
MDRGLREKALDVVKEDTVRGEQGPRRRKRREMFHCLDNLHGLLFF